MKIGVLKKYQGTTILNEMAKTIRLLNHDIGLNYVKTVKVSKYPTKRGEKNRERK